MGPKDEVIASQEIRQELKPGWSMVSMSIAIKLKALTDARTSWLNLYRLRYSVSADGSGSDGTAATTGILSLYRIIAQTYDLQVFGPEYVLANQPYSVRTRAVDSHTGLPAAGVEIEASLKLENEREAREAGLTDNLGYATFDFKIPSGSAASAAELTVTGKRGGLIRQVRSDINIMHGAQVLITTDKPIYKPGQVVHARVMIFDSNRLAVADESATLSIEDPDGTAVFSSKVTTKKRNKYHRDREQRSG
jgi:hypothetical protein